VPLLHIFILALVQGITEFLPVSSSGHLLLTHHVLEGGAANLCWEENRTFDVAVHVGTLASVLVYFRRDLWEMAMSLNKPHSAGFRLMFRVGLASLPVIGAGLALQVMQPSFLCLVQTVAWTTLIFGALLWIADRKSDARTLESLKWTDALIIGCAQVLSLVPGTSRSGITMTAGRFLGFKRTEAARFALLMSIVASSGAGAVSAHELMQEGNAALGLDALLAVVLSFLAGIGAIAFMMRWLQRSSFTVFAVYRVALGLILLGLIYSGVLA
jgi:undecaprenyl-diphosphatase